MNSGENTVNQLLSDEKAIQEKLARVRKSIMQLEADLQHIQGAIAFYRRNTSSLRVADFDAEIKVATATPEMLPMIPLSRLKGLSHSNAAIAIARHNGGVVRTQEAKRLMIKAGIMSNTKNSTNMAHNAIKRTEMFDKVSPGEYRLRSDINGDLENFAKREGLPFNGEPVQ
jgi:hypothetical protein